MKKVLAKVTAIVLTLALVAGIAPSFAAKNAAAKSSKVKIKISVSNADDFDPLEYGDSIKVKIKITATGGTKAKRKKVLAAVKKAGFKYSNYDKKVVSIDKKGNITGIAVGTTAIKIEAKYTKTSVKAITLGVEVFDPDLAEFKFFNGSYYFVVDDKSQFPITANLSKADVSDELGNTYGAEIDYSTVSDYTFASTDTSCVSVDQFGNLIITGYGEADISSIYKKDEDVGDITTINVMTSEEYAEAEIDYGNDDDEGGDDDEGEDEEGEDEEGYDEDEE